MFQIYVKNLITGDYDTPDTPDLLHKGDIIFCDGEPYEVIGGQVLPRQSK